MARRRLQTLLPIIVVFLLSCLFVACVSSDEHRQPDSAPKPRQSAPLVRYSANILMRPYLKHANEFWALRGHAVEREWTFVRRRSILSEMLLIPDGPDTIRIVADSRLTDDEYLMAVDAWQSPDERARVDYIKIFCLENSERRQQTPQCVCATFRKSKSAENRSGDDMHHDISSSSSWFSDGVVRCDRLPTSLVTGTFKNFSSVRVLDLAGLTIRNMDDEVFGELSSLELLRFDQVKLPWRTKRFDNLLESFERRLTSVQLSNVFLREAEELENSSALNNASVGSSSTINISSSVVDDFDGNLLNISSLAIRSCRLFQLKDDAFDRFNPDTLMSVDLSSNEIERIDDHVFSNLHSLRELILFDNRLVFLPKGAFTGLRSLRYLELMSNQLMTFETTSLPAGDTLNVINLSRNNLSAIEGSFNATPKLIIIHLGGNRLSNISGDTFQNCSQIMSLLLHNNRIESIDSSAFRGTLNIVELDISNNSLWNATAVRELFWNTETTWLQPISLHHNNLSVILPDMFARPSMNQSQLTVSLDLSNNRIQQIRPNAFQGLVKLVIVSLENNQIASLNDEVFDDLVDLEYLDLDNNRLATLPELIFLSTQKLAYISIKNNSLTQLPQNMSMPQSLTRIYFESNQLAEIPLFMWPLPKLDALSLINNRITTATRDRLARFPNLIILDLTHNLLTTFEDGTFADNAVLATLNLQHNLLDLNFSIDYFHRPINQFKPTLGLLMLSHNRIRSARHLFRFPSIYNTQIIDLSNNPLGEFTSTVYGENSSPFKLLYVIKLYMSNCSLTAIGETVLEMAHSLQLLDIANNLLTEFRSLQILNRFYTVVLDGNPIKCTCRMKWLRNPQFSGHYRLTHCYHSVTGQLVPFDSIPETFFLCKISGQCLVDAAACSCYSDDDSHPNIPTHLICSNRRLDRFPENIQATVRVIYFERNNVASITKVSQTYRAVTELYMNDNLIETVEDGAIQNFPNLVVLSLNGNMLTRISSRMFSAMYKLETVQLHDNLLVAIDTDAFSDFRALRSLTLHGNELSELPNEVLSDLESLPYLMNLTLHDNPWTCRCDNATFKNWIGSRIDVIDNTTEIRCNGTSESILKLPDDYFICYDRRLVVRDLLTGPLSASMTASCLLVVVVICLIASYRHRHVIHVLLYNTHLRLRLTRRRENDETDHDAVIFYDDDDDEIRRWVLDELRQRLLDFDARFRVFVPDVDLAPGVDELNSIADGVTRSRRTIVVVGRRTVDNPYVMYAFKFAYHRMTTDDDTHDILLILTDDLDVTGIVEDEDMDSNFVAYLTAGKRMKMSDRRFWPELNFFMPEMNDDVIAAMSTSPGGVGEIVSLRAVNL